MTDRYITIRPEDLLAGPLKQCPKCRAEKFGLAGVGPDSYSLLCTACRYHSRIGLPRLQKRVIYLDQLAISNLMFALDPETAQLITVLIPSGWTSSID
jgi:hypothetical protein